MDREVVRRADGPEASPEPWELDLLTWRGARRRPVTPSDPWEACQRLASSGRVPLLPLAERDAPSAHGAPGPLCDSGSGRAAPPACGSPVLVSAADLLAGATVLVRADGAVQVRGRFDKRLPDWARILGKLRFHVQRLQWRRALYLRALDAGVGVSLGWAERRGTSSRCLRTARLLCKVLRLVLSALLERPRSAAGAAAVAALYQFVPIGRGGVLDA